MYKLYIYIYRIDFQVIFPSSVFKTKSLNACNEIAIKLLMKSLLMTCRIGTILANWSTNYFFLHWYPYNISTKIIIFLFHIHSPFDPIQKVAGTTYASRQKSLLVTKIIILRLKPVHLDERPA